MRLRVTSSSRILATSLLNRKLNFMTSASCGLYSPPPRFRITVSLRINWSPSIQHWTKQQDVQITGFCLRRLCRQKPTCAKRTHMRRAYWRTTKLEQRSAASLQSAAVSKIGRDDHSDLVSPKRRDQKAALLEDDASTAKSSGPRAGRLGENEIPGLEN